MYLASASALASAPEVASSASQEYYKHAHEHNPATSVMPYLIAGADGTLTLLDVHQLA